MLSLPHDLGEGGTIPVVVSKVIFVFHLPLFCPPRVFPLRGLGREIYSLVKLMKG